MKKTAPDAYQLATKKLIKQTLVVLTIVLITGISLSGYAILKMRSNKNSALAQATATPQVLSETTPPFVATPFPTATPNSSSSASPSSTPSLSPSLTPSLSPSSTPSPTPQPSTDQLTLNPESVLEGYQSNNNTGDLGKELRIGRNSQAITRSFLSFNLQSLAPNKPVVNAMLRLFQVKTDGNPYTSGGELKIDHITYGDTLDNSDYAASSLVSSFATVSNNSDKTWKEVDVTNLVKNDLQNNRKHTQYRLHFSIENKEAGQSGTYTYFESSENTLNTNNKPQLVVKY
jgi:hypothetical protein